MPDLPNATRSLLLNTGLGFTAGFVDTLGFVALFGLFTAHVTGNFVLIGAELAHPHGGVLLKLLAFPAFVAAVALTRMLTQFYERRQQHAARPLLTLQAFLLLGFMSLGLAAEPVTSPNAPLALLAGIVGAMAMGVQNAASRLVMKALVPTTVMTGNVTQVVIEAVDLFVCGSNADLTSRFKNLLSAVLAFASGAIGGAFGYVWISFWALLLPAVLLAALTVITAKPVES